MLSAERQRAILETLNRDGSVRVVDLAKRFGASRVTIRKDLETLDANGRIRRTHGGAVSSRENALDDPTLLEKERLHREEKLLIAEAAASMVSEGQVVILDSGTTTSAIARVLMRNFKNLTIITNAVNIAVELRGSHLEVILTGGNLRTNSFSLVGPLAEETLSRLSADVLFLGVDGFDVNHGLSTPNLLEARVNRSMMDVSKMTIAVCDSSKFGKRSLSVIAPPSALHGVITDQGASKSDLNALRKLGLKVTVV